jgi:SAM-dependent methyltransferase
MLKLLMKTLHAPVYRTRTAALLRQIVPELRQNDRVLDVGCGSGVLAAALRDDASAPEGLHVEGLERVRRRDEAIPVTEYDGSTIPLGDHSFDVVMLLDVLHHEPDPDQLIRECRRITRRLLIIKDHQRSGLFAWSRIALMDWAANAPYDVPCLYRYNTPAEWADSHRRLKLRPLSELHSMRIYPPFYDLWFGGSLQYFAVLEPIQSP